MKKILMFVAAALTLAACSDNMVVCDDIETVIYISNNGLQQLTLPADAPVYELWIQKAGYNTLPCQISLNIDAEDIAVFNATNKSNYKLMPSNCYELDRERVSFSGNMRNDRVLITFDPSCLPLNEQFLLPIRIRSNDVKILDENQTVTYLQVKIKE